MSNKTKRKCLSGSLFSFILSMVVAALSWMHCIKWTELVQIKPPHIVIGWNLKIITRPTTITVHDSGAVVHINNLAMFMLMFTADALNGKQQRRPKPPPPQNNSDGNDNGNVNVNNVKWGWRWRWRWRRHSENSHSYFNSIARSARVKRHED